MLCSAIAASATRAWSTVGFVASQPEQCDAASIGDGVAVDAGSRDDDPVAGKWSTSGCHEQRH